MKRNIPLLIFVIILSVLAFLIAVPSFAFIWNGQEVRVNGLDPSDFGLNFVNPEFTFQSSVDMQGGSLITLNADLTATEEAKRVEALDQIKSTLYYRLWNARVEGFKLNVISDSMGIKNKIILKAPLTIDENTLNLLLAPANMSVWVEDPTMTDNTVTASGTMESFFKQIFGNRKQISITNQDITGVSIVSDSRCYFQDTTMPRNYCIKIILSDTATTEFAAELKANPYATLPVVIALDYSPIGVQAQGQLYNPADVGREILIYPLFDDNNLITSILASMIGSEPLNSNVKLESIKSLAPLMGEMTMEKLKISLALGVIAANALIIYYFRKRGILFTTTFILFLIWSIALMKVVNLPLSFSIIAGFLLAALMFIAVFISAEYKIRSAFKGNLTADELKDIYSQISNKIRNAALAVLVIDFAVGYYGTADVISFMTGMGMAMIGMLLITILAFKALLPFMLLKKKHE